MKTNHPKPRVVIDARMIGPVGHGIAEYVRDLVLGLSEIPDKNYETHLLISEAMPAEDPLRKNPHTVVHAPFLSPLELIQIPIVLRKLRADLFHSPSFSAHPFLNMPTIYTVHDLIHLKYGSLLQKIYYEFILKRALNRAVQVCTVSEFSRSEIASWLGWPKERIEVVKNAIHVEDPPLDVEERLKKWGLTKFKYNFSLSSSKPHKNMGFLIRAYLAHAEKNPEAWPLVVSLTQDEVEFKHPKIICLGRVNSNDKTTLLAGAGAFYFPSLIEGFGRPPLEAAAYGVPVAVSDIEVLKEVLDGVSQKIFCSATDPLPWISAFRLSEKNNRTRASSEQAWSRLDLGKKTNEIYEACVIRFAQRQGSSETRKN